MVIAISIIAIIVILFVRFNVNNDVDGENEYNEIINQAKIVSDYLFSEGSPTNWNSTNVVRLGLTDGNNVLDKIKLEKFSNLSKLNYDKSLELLRLRYDYLVFFKDYDDNILNLTEDKYYGKNGVNDTNIEDQNPINLFKVSRFIVDKQGNINVSSRIIEMIIYF